MRGLFLASAKAQTHGFEQWLRSTFLSSKAYYMGRWHSEVSLRWSELLLTHLQDWISARPERYAQLSTQISSLCAANVSRFAAAFAQRSSLLSKLSALRCKAFFLIPKHNVEKNDMFDTYSQVDMVYGTYLELDGTGSMTTSLWFHVWFFTADEYFSCFAALVHLEHQEQLRVPLDFFLASFGSIQ
jgi:hypothetical protein